MSIKARIANWMLTLGLASGAAGATTIFIASSNLDVDNAAYTPVSVALTDEWNAFYIAASTRAGQSGEIGTSENPIDPESLLPADKEHLDQLTRTGALLRNFANFERGAHDRTADKGFNAILVGMGLAGAGAALRIPKAKGERGRGL